ncbi:MAG TPA: hypothetical protein VKK31_04480 [Thermoanaerobaculia bacterium]|nr:hypothetical protein [Thermoanaerobaculia bacterium]
MSAADFQSRQQIVQEFKRRRGREIAMAFPFVAALLVAWQAYDDPDFLLFGLSGVPLFGTALGVVAACLAHHAFNWRCPVCQRHFRTGISVPFCPQCGAVFEESRDPLAMADPDAARREQVENAVQAELKMYQSKYALHLMRGMVTVLIGSLITFSLADDPVKPDGWLGRTFGEADTHALLRTAGAVLLLAGLAWIAYAVRALTGGARRHTEEVRRFLETKAAETQKG